MMKPPFKPVVLKAFENQIHVHITCMTTFHMLIVTQICITMFI